jgi:hypothetical protein
MPGLLPLDLAEAPLLGSRQLLTSARGYTVRFHRLAGMDRVASKLLEWKGIYNALDAAQTALVAALRTGAADDEVERLRRKIGRLRAQSDAALKALDERIAT